MAPPEEVRRQWPSSSSRSVAWAHESIVTIGALSVDATDVSPSHPEVGTSPAGGHSSSAGKLRSTNARARGATRKRTFAATCPRSC
jgi:hypothetical protein